MALQGLIEKNKENARANPALIQHLELTLQEKAIQAMEIQAIEATPEVQSRPVGHSLPEVTIDNAPEIIPAPAPAKASKAKTSTSTSPLGALEEWIKETAKQGLDSDQVRAIIKEELSLVAPRRIEIVAEGVATQVEGLVHYQFELVLRAIQSGVNLGLCGCSGTGKTFMAIQVAKAMNRDFMLFKSVASSYELTGYTDNSGNYVQSNLYRAHKAGKLAIFDEFDGSDANAALVLNSIIENKTYTYPNGETVYNPDFQVVFTMNSHGQGGDRKFVGRNRLDAATLDRLAILEVERDLALEAALIGITESPKALNIGSSKGVTPEHWLNVVRECREEYSRTKPDKIVSSRAVRDGWALLQAGIGEKHVIAMTITK